MKRTLALIVASFAFFTAWTFYEFPGFLDNLAHVVPFAFPPDDGFVYNGSLLGGDHFQAHYLGWKLRHAFLAGENLLTDPYTFSSKLGTNYDFHIGIQFVSFALMGALFGDIAGYFLANTVLALTLAFLFGFYMAQSLTRSRFVALCAGLALSLVPYHIAQMMGGHSGGYVYLLLPLYLGAIFSARQQAGNTRAVALAGFTLFLAVISDEHQAYYLLLLSGVLFPIWGLQTVLSVPRRQALAAAGAYLWQWRYLILGLLAVVAYGEILSRLVLGGSDGASHNRRTLTEISHFSKHLTPFHQAGSRFNIGHLLGPCLGLTTLLWIGVGVRRRDWLAFLKSPALACVLAFPLCLFTMVGVGSHWSQQTGVYHFLFEHMPYFDLQRVPIKIFGLVACLLVALACMAFEGMRQQARRHQGWRRRALLGLAGLLAFGLAAQGGEYLSYFAKYRGRLHGVDMRQGPQAVYTYLQTQGKPEDIVLTVPVGNADGRYDTLNFVHAMKSGARMAAGYNGAPPWYFRSRMWSLQEGLHDGAFTRKTSEYLLGSGISYLLLDLGMMAQLKTVDLKQAFAHKPFLKEVLCDAGYCLYQVDRERLAAEPIVPDQGFTVSELWRGDLGRWMRSGADAPAWAAPGLLDDFPVYSRVAVPANEASAGGRACVAINFKFLSHQMPLWVLDESGEAREFAAPWPSYGNGFRITMPVKGAEFLLATKDSWRPPEWSPKLYPALGPYIWGVEKLGSDACLSKSSQASNATKVR